MVLETPRLLLRPFDVKDSGDVFAYASDPRVGPPAGWPPHQNYMESWITVQTVFSEPNVFAMVLKETGRVVGSVGLVGGHPGGEDPACPDDELGYAIGYDYWNRGLTTEAAEAVIRYSFEELGLRRLWCSHYEGNERSRRVMEKCGFRYCYHQPTEVVLFHETRETYFYCLTEEAWRERLQSAL